MKKFVIIILILALIILTAVVAKVNPKMHKTFQIERIIIIRGVK